MDNPIRIGIIGAGGIVKHRHLPGLKQIPEVKITAVCNRSPESTQKVAQEYGIPHCLPSWKDVVHHPEVDVVLIGTWPYLHHDISIESLNVGKPVFCQARMARNLAEAREMLAVQRASGKVAMLCPPPHGMTWDRSIRRLLQEGYVGKVLSVRVQSFHDRFLDPEAPLSWRQDDQLSGYNVLVLGIFAEVVRRWFGNHKSIQATSQTMIKERRDPETGNLRPVNIPDAVWVHAEMDSGAVVQYSFSGISHAASSERVEIYGSEGTLVYETALDKVFGARLSDETLKELPLPVEEKRVWEVELDFIRALKGEKAPDPSFEDGVAYMEVVEAVARSCQSGNRIQLPLP